MAIRDDDDKVLYTLDVPGAFVNVAFKAWRMPGRKGSRAFAPSEGYEASTPTDHVARVEVVVSLCQCVASGGRVGRGETRHVADTDRAAGVSSTTTQRRATTEGGPTEGCICW